MLLKASEPTVHLRQMILKKCLEDMYHFLHHENGQVAIYDAVNPLSTGRRSLAEHFADYDIQVISTTLATNTQSPAGQKAAKPFNRHYLSNPHATTTRLSRRMSEMSRFLPRT